MDYKFIEKEINTAKHNLFEAQNQPLSKNNDIYIKEQLKEIDRLNFKVAKFEDEFKKLINLNNCHLIVEYMLHRKPELIEAIVNEYQAQIRFGEK